MSKKVFIGILFVILILLIGIVAYTVKEEIAINQTNNTYDSYHSVENIINKEDNNTNIIIAKNILSLNGDDDLDKFILYKNKKIYFTQGRKDPENKVYYREYNLIVYNTAINRENIIANTFDNNVVLCNNKIYYFVENFENRDEKIFYSYNLDTEEIESMEITPKIEKIYTIISHENNIYFGVSLSQEDLKYGVIRYNIESNKSELFCDLDIRYLDENFLFTGNGFVSALHNKLYFIDLDGNISIKYSNESDLGENIKIENNLLIVPVLGLSSKGSYLTTIKNLKFNINNLELVEEEFVNE